jgi:hypothetical protein
MYNPLPEVSQPLDRGLQGQEGEQFSGCHPSGDHLLPAPRDGVPGRHSRLQITVQLSNSPEKCEKFTSTVLLLSSLLVEDLASWHH